MSPYYKYYIFIKDDKLQSNTKLKNTDFATSLKIFELKLYVNHVLITKLCD